MRYALTRIASNTPVSFREFDEAPPVLAEAKGLVWVESPIVIAVPSLADAKTSKVADIKARRDYLTLNGGHKIGANWYHSNELSLIQQLVLDGMAKQMAAAGAPDATPLAGIPPWKTLNGPAVVLTVGIAKNFVMSAMVQQGMLFASAAAKIATIEGLASVELVESFDVTADWPETAPL